MLPQCSAMSSAMLWLPCPKKCEKRAACALELMGKNSVMPCIIASAIISELIIGASLCFMRELVSSFASIFASIFASVFALCFYDISYLFAETC